MAQAKPLSGRTKLLSEATSLQKELHSTMRVLTARRPGDAPPPHILAKPMQSDFAGMPEAELQTYIANARRELEAIKRVLLSESKGK